jgi:RNA polymerase sigma-70 factor (ECF subfamily)
MAEDEDFLDLLRRVRAGEEEAAAELVRRYEPAVRRAVRFRLSDSRLRRVCDSADICQAVLGSFFVRAASGQYDLQTPEQLLKLLATMARNKIAKLADRQQAARRDHRRLAAAPVEEHDVLDSDPSPSKKVAARELLAEAHRRLAPDERRLAELRMQGHDWASIAALVGGMPEALRKRLARAIERVATELGLDEVAGGE